MTDQQRSIARALIEAALVAVDPAAAVLAAVTCQGPVLTIGQRTYDLEQLRRIVVVGAGKAAVPMARALEQIMGEWISTGLIITKQGHTQGPPLKRIEVVEARHPLPDDAGLAHSARLIALVDSLGAADLLIGLISGGGSSLLTLPATGITLHDLQQMNDLLLGAGLPIPQVNAVRKHLSQIKGGQLAARAAPAAVSTLILSDVVGNSLQVIASGPTVPDSTTFSEALEVLQRAGLEARAPGSITRYLRDGAAGVHPETPKPGATLFNRVENHLVGSNEIAARAAQVQAQTLGLHCLILTTFLEGEAREVGRMYGALLREIATYDRPLPRPACLIVGGETTVTLRGHGKGGRNQELALAAALALTGLPDVMLVALATDGTDGPTDAGGAWVDGTTCARASALGLNTQQHLDENNAYPFFDRLGDLIRLGPTGTNVNDLAFLLAY